MKYAIVGSRDFTDYDKLKSVLDEYDYIESIISGRCKGADLLAERYANENNIPTIIYEADWKDFSTPCITKSNKYGEYNSLAGIHRNTKIVESSDIVIAFWNGKSNGTKDSINKAKKLNKKLVIID